MISIHPTAAHDTAAMFCCEMSD